MHLEHRAQSHLPGAAPRLRITLATAVAVLAGVSLGACNRDATQTDATTTTAAGPGAAEPGVATRGAEPSEQRPGELGRMDEPQVQPSPTHQPTTAAPPAAVPEHEEQVMARQEVMATRAQQACPIMVEGTNVEVEETGDGVTMRFTTTASDKVDDLRSRVEHMSRMYGEYGKHGGKGKMMWHHMGHKRAEGDRPRMGKGPSGMMPAATAKVENIQNGAQLVLTPTDSGQLSALREHARDHQQRMNAGECWWMEGMEEKDMKEMKMKEKEKTGEGAQY
ncbi:MAG: hypothetical protein R6X02_15945 [Enhygromyxa sp.]